MGRDSATAQSPPPASPLFIESAAQTGLAFTHVSGASGQYYMAEQMGAGVALFDYDADGDLDVFLVQGGPFEPGGKIGSTHPTSRLFRNDLKVAADGRRTLHFTDVTQAAGVGLRGHGMGAVVGDYDNDGDLDLFVTSFGPETLYRNNGDGTFSDVTKQAGVSDPLWSASGAFVDYDRDGDLDLFVTNYLDFTVTDNKRCNDALGARDYCSPRAYRPVPDRLYRNEGGGRFINVTEAAGISKADGAGLGVSTGDYNADGWLDLYVANDATPNQLWINQRNGTFVDEGLLSGSALNAAGNPEGSMGIASGDFDLDGDEDLVRHEHRRRDLCRLPQRRPREFRRCARPGGTVRTDGGVHRLRHRLVRLRQRRLARPLHRQRGGQHRRGAARGEVPVPDAEPVVSQHRRREVGGRQQGSGARLSNARRSVAERRLATSTTTAMSMSS